MVDHVGVDVFEGSQSDMFFQRCGLTSLSAGLCWRDLSRSGSALDAFARLSYSFSTDM